MNIFEERCALHKFPWILYSHGEHNREHTFYSLSERRVRHKCIKEMVDNDIVCSLHGWLILSNQIDHRSCQLFNPVSMETIQLPLLPRPSYNFCTLSCDPNNQNCIVMLIKAEEGMATCYFCRPGDVVWTKKDLELGTVRPRYCDFPDSIRAVGCYKGQICIFTRFAKILLLAANPPYLTRTDLGEQQLPCYALQHRNVQRYLVESDGELFVIRRFDLRIDAYDFAVGKLDISEKKIVDVENLGGRALFLSTSSSGIICSAENHGIKGNTIYFTKPSDPCIYSFDLQKKVLTFSLPCPNVKRNLVQAEWILLVSPNAPSLQVDIISPLQIKRSTVLSIGKDWSLLAGVAGKLSRFADSGWSELPHDVLISIAEKLSCVSCARIATVCKSWRSVITRAPKKLHGYPIFLHMPSSSIEVFHFMNESRYNVSVPENPEVLSIRHAKYGWLLMTRHIGNKLFFLNPLTSEIIEIPDLPAQVRSYCFTALPTSFTCSVMAICEIDSGPHPFVFHIRRGMMRWTRVEIHGFQATGDFELTPYSNPVFHGGVFYWIWGYGNLCTYDPMEEKVKFLVEPQSPCRSVCISYLFESGKKLMSVWAGRHGEWVRVYELDEASMAWKEVNTLDNKVVFLSRNSSLVIEMQELEDMICFNRFVGDNQPLMYSLKTGELGVYGGGHHAIRDFFDIPEYQIKSAWIMPNVKQHSAQELSWYNVVHWMLSTTQKWLHRMLSTTQKRLNRMLSTTQKRLHFLLKLM